MWNTFGWVAQRGAARKTKIEAALAQPRYKKRARKIDIPPDQKRIIEQLLQRHSIAEPGILDHLDEEGFKQAISFLPLDEREKIQAWASP